MVALGVVLSTVAPNEALVRHRLAKGDKSLHQLRRHFTGKAPVTLKLDAEAVGICSVFNAVCPLDPRFVNGGSKTGEDASPADFCMRQLLDEGQVAYNSRALAKVH